MILYYITQIKLLGNQKLFKKLFEGHIVEWIFAFIVISFLIWLIVWIVGRFRENEDRQVDADELLLQFSEMRREGDLTDDEFRSIKKRLVEPRVKRLDKEDTADQIEDSD